MNTYHPTTMLLHGLCSRCHARFDWRLLEPLTTLHQKIKMLCPGCRMDTVEPTCKEA